MVEISRIPRTLKENEQVIERGMNSFMDVAQALLDIKNQKQFREAGYDSFEDYCQNRWRMSARNGYRYIQCAEVVDNVTRVAQSDSAPTTIRQAAALAAASDDPQEQADLWDATVESTNGRPTENAIREVAEARKAKDAVRDALGGTLPESLTDDWSAISEFRSISNAIGSVGERIEKLADTPGGRKIELEKAVSAQNELQAIVKFAKPYTECWRCKRKVKQGCKLCRGSGWVSVGEYERNKTPEGDTWLQSRE